MILNIVSQIKTLLMKVAFSLKGFLFILTLSKMRI